MAVQAQLMKEQALAAHSRKAQYYERMQLKDEEFAFVDEEGLPTVEIVGEFTPTVRVLSLDTDEFVQLRDAFRRLKVCAFMCACAFVCLSNNLYGAYFSALFLALRACFLHDISQP